MIDLNERAKEVHTANEKWWVDLETGERIVRNKGEFLMLVVSEIAEAMEGERKDLMDDHLPHRKMAEVEMADAYIRLLDYAGGYGVDLDFTPRTWEGFPKNKGEGLFQIVWTIVEFSNYAVPNEKKVKCTPASFGIFWKTFIRTAICTDTTLKAPFTKKNGV